MKNQYYLLNLYLLAYCTVTVFNLLFFGVHYEQDWEIEAQAFVFEEPDHGEHYDFEIATFNEVYYLDLTVNRIFTESGSIDITFQSYIDMSAWMANRTEEEAFQVNVLLTHYKSVVADKVHSDTLDARTNAKRKIIEVLENLGKDTLQQDTFFIDTF